MAKMVKIKDWSGKRPKAAPVLWMCVRRKKPSLNSECPSGRLDLIHALLSWSAPMMNRANKKNIR
jgi:hypothetical protein